MEHNKVGVKPVSPSSTKSMNQTPKFLYQKCRCPDCHYAPLTFLSGECRCSNCGATFPLRQGIPVLIRHDNEVFPIESYCEPANESFKRKSLGLARFIPSPSVNLSHRRSIQLLAESLTDFSPGYVLVIGAGRQKGYLEDFFASYPQIQIIYTDIDLSAEIDVFCDAHELPFIDQVFQGVIVTGVLEHVMYPERAVVEIYRLLVDGGVVYSEIPFMQQVHEGAYDFTRYTLSGHRRLFNRFQELSSGLTAGPATAMVWTLENFALCFAPTVLLRLMVKAGVRLTFFWLKYLDYLLKDIPQAMDSASGTYFVGRKDPSVYTSDKIIIERYVGAKHLDHL